MHATKQDRLDAKVKAVNRANTYARTLYKSLRAALTPFIGQVIKRNDGELLKKVAKTLPTFQNDKDIMVYMNHSPYTLAWIIKTSEYLAQGCIYHETTIYIGNVQSGTLTDLMEPLDLDKDLRIDFTAQEIEEKREAYKAAKRAADEAKSNLYPFGESDQ